MHNVTKIAKEKAILISGWQKKLKKPILSWNDAINHLRGEGDVILLELRNSIKFLSPHRIITRGK